MSNTTNWFMSQQMGGGNKSTINLQSILAYIKISGDTDNQHINVTSNFNIRLLNSQNQVIYSDYSDFSGYEITSTSFASNMFYFDNIQNNIASITFSFIIQYTGSYRILNPYSELFDRDNYSLKIGTDSITISQTGINYSLSGSLNINKIDNPKSSYDTELDIIIPLING